MKTYVLIAGGVFGLITLAHLWRMVVEPHVRTEPWFLFATIVSTALSIAAFRVARRAARGGRT